MSLVLENVAIMIEIIVFRDFMTLVKYVQILSLFNQAHIITRIIVSLVFKIVIVRTAVLFSEILWVWLNMIKFCHYLTKPIITRIIVSLVF